MATSNKIHCTVVAVPMHQDFASPRLAPRPSELVPWADPYIASLIEKLQTEVRLEREGQNPPREVDSPRPDLAAAPSLATVVCELEIPWNDDSFDYEPGEDRFSDYGDDPIDAPMSRV